MDEDIDMGQPVEVSGNQGSEGETRPKRNIDEVTDANESDRGYKRLKAGVTEIIKNTFTRIWGGGSLAVDGGRANSNPMGRLLLTYPGYDATPAHAETPGGLIDASTSVEAVSSDAEAASASKEAVSSDVEAAGANEEAVPSDAEATSATDETDTDDTIRQVMPASHVQRRSKRVEAAQQRMAQELASKSTETENASVRKAKEKQGDNSADIENAPAKKAKRASKEKEKKRKRNRKGAVEDSALQKKDGETSQKSSEIGTSDFNFKVPKPAHTSSNETSRSVFDLAYIQPAPKPSTSKPATNQKPKGSSLFNFSNPQPANKKPVEKPAEHISPFLNLADMQPAPKPSTSKRAIINPKPKASLIDFSNPQAANKKPEAKPAEHTLPFLNLADIQPAPKPSTSKPAILTSQPVPLLQVQDESEEEDSEYQETGTEEESMEDDIEKPKVQLLQVQHESEEEGSEYKETHRGTEEESTEDDIEALIPTGEISEPEQDPRAPGSSKRLQHSAGPTTPMQDYQTMDTRPDGQHSPTPEPTTPTQNRSSRDTRPESRSDDLITQMNHHFNMMRDDQVVLNRALRQEWETRQADVQCMFADERRERWRYEKEIRYMIQTSDDARKNDMQHLSTVVDGIVKSAVGQALSSQDILKSVVEQASPSRPQDENSQSEGERIRARPTSQRKGKGKQRPVNVIKEPVAFKDHPLRTDFNTAVRTHVRRLFKIPENAELDVARLPLVSDEEIFLFNIQDFKTKPITPSNFRVDFSRKLAHPFNIQANKVAAADFIRLAEEGKYKCKDGTPIPSFFLEKSVVRQRVQGCLAHLQDKYKVLTSENPEEAKRQKLARSARATRKNKLYSERISVVSQESDLLKHAKLIKAIGTAGVSSDETDTGAVPKRFNTIAPSWRSKALEIFYQRIDSQVERKKAQQIGNMRHKPRGSQPRQRVRTDMKNLETIAPQRLPSNCYDSDWLQGLMQSQLNELAPKGVYEFDDGAPGLE